MKDLRSILLPRIKNGVLESSSIESTIKFSKYHPCMLNQIILTCVKLSLALTETLRVLSIDEEDYALSGRKQRIMAG